MRRRLGLFAVFVVMLVTTVLGIAATLNRRAAESREARANIESGAELMASLVDESLEELRSREDGRPYDQYNEVYRPEGVVAASDAVAPSPLSKQPDDKRILGWFQVNPDGSLTVPHERSRKEAAQQVRELLMTPAFAALRALAKPKAGLEEIDPELALLDSQLGYARQQSLQELNAASAEVYKQLKEADEAPQKRAALAENPKLPTIERNDIDWASGELGKIGSRAKPVKPNPSKKKSKAGSVAVDYTPMVFDTVDVNAQRSVRVLHRVVAKGGSTAVQGVILDEGFLQSQWLPGLLQRRVGMTPAILAHPTPALCTLRTPVSGVLDDIDLCFDDNDRARFPFAEVTLLVSLFVLVVLVLVVLDRTAARSEALSHQKSAFISAISHELRTPLTTLRMHAELMRDGLVTDPDKQHRFHDDMVKESVRLGHLVENVLEAQRLEEGRRPLRATRFDVGEAVAEICDAQRALCDSRGFAVRVDLPPDDVALTGNFDRQALEQMVVNLIENAVKYARDAAGRGLDVSVTREHAATTGRASGSKGDVVVVTVRDRGPGIPKGEREKVFQRFHRVVRPGEEHIAGTGLGLALVRELARAHGGDAVVEDVDEGCAVAVRLPLGG